MNTIIWTYNRYSARLSLQYVLNLSRRAVTLELLSSACQVKNPRSLLWPLYTAYGAVWLPRFLSSATKPSSLPSTPHFSASRSPPPPLWVWRISRHSSFSHAPLLPQPLLLEWLPRVAGGLSFRRNRLFRVGNHQRRWGFAIANRVEAARYSW